MISKTSRTSDPAGGEALLGIIAASVIAVVAAEATFIAFPSWWLLVLVLLGVIAATIGVIAALLRTIDQDTPVARPSGEPQSAERPAPAVARRTAPAGRTARPA